MVGLNANSRAIRLFSMLGLLLFTLSLAGCSTLSQLMPGPSIVQPQTNDGFMSYSQMVDDYQAAQATMPLAPGDVYPPFPDGYDKSGRYQALYGQVIAFGVYQCSWENEWLNTRAKDSDRAATALSVLLKIQDNTVFIQTYDGSLKKVMVDAFSKAAEGDPSGVQSLAAAC